MPICQLQIQVIAIWSNPCRRYVPPKIHEVFKDLPNIFGITDDILLVGYDSNGMDYDDTLRKGTTNMQTDKPETKQI